MSQFLFGNQITTGNTAINISPNTARSETFTVPNSCSIESVNFYNSNSGGVPTRGAVFNATSGALLGLTSVVTPSAVGDVALPLASSIAVSSGDSIQLVVGASGYQSVLYDTTGAFYEPYANITDITIDADWPNPWAQTGTGNHGGHMGVYAYGTVTPTGPTSGIPSLTLEDKTGTLMAAGTSVSVTVDTTTGTNVYPMAAQTITSANQIPVIDLSSAVTAGTIAVGDTVNYSITYGGETTIYPLTVTANPT